MKKTKHKYHKLIAYILCINTLLSILNIPVYSNGNVSEKQLDAIPANEIGNITVETIQLTATDCPETISLAEAQEKGHIKRLREKENDDNTVVFQNEDGSETMYIFAQPVKYTDDSGISKDKRTTLSASQNGFITASNDVNAHFSSDITEGVSLSKDNINISMTPITTESISSNAVAQNNKVLYRNVFGSDTSIIYSPLLSGIKEDIILTRYTGQTSFSFSLNTGGLMPHKNSNGSISFFDIESNKEKAKMAQVICYDANENFAGGEITLTEITPNQEYVITVYPDHDFLADEKTVYPVSVDPTLTFDTTVAIEDTVIYSGTPNANFGSNHYHHVGYVNDTYKIGRMMVRFPNLRNNALYLTLTEDQIISAKYSVYTSGSSSGTASIMTYIDTYNWSENSVTWNSYTPALAPFELSARNIPSGAIARTDFNVTEAVKEWKNGSITWATGLIFLNQDESEDGISRGFISTEYATAYRPACMPYLEININCTVIDLYAVDANQHDHISCLQYAKTLLNSSDFDNVVIHEGAFTTEECKQTLDNTNVFTSRSHGYMSNGNVGLMLNENTPPNALFGYEFNTSINTYAFLEDDEDYSNIDIALFVGCSTAIGDETGNNLVRRIVELGADVAIGFSGNISCIGANYWTERFYEYMLQGYTVGEAAVEAKEATIDFYIDDHNTGVDSLVIVGDDSVVLS